MGSCVILLACELACEQALHLGDIVKSTRARGTREETDPSRLRSSLARSRAACFARPNRRACSQANKMTMIFFLYLDQSLSALLGA